MYKNTFKMNNGDIVIENNDLVLVGGQEELRQNIENRVSVNINEWFLNTGLGLDYAAIQGKGISDAQIDLAIRECCLQDDRVKEVKTVLIERNAKDRTADIRIIIIDKNDIEVELSEVMDID